MASSSGRTARLNNRVTPKTKEWLASYATAQGISESAALEHLLTRSLRPWAIERAKAEERAKRSR